MTYEIAIRNKLRALLESKGVSQADLAGRLGVAKSTVARPMTQRPITSTFVDDVLKAIDATAEELFAA